MTKKLVCYSTFELSQILQKKINKYGSKQALNQALHRNQNNGGKNSFLSAIWDIRTPVGKSFCFEKGKVNKILGVGKSS